MPRKPIDDSKRRRNLASCDICKKAKTKCNGEEPCNRCKARGSVCMYIKCGMKQRSRREQQIARKKRRHIAPQQLALPVPAEPSRSFSSLIFTEQNKNLGINHNHAPFPAEANGPAFYAAPEQRDEVVFAAASSLTSVATVMNLDDLASNPVMDDSGSNQRFMASRTALGFSTPAGRLESPDTIYSPSNRSNSSEDLAGYSENKSIDQFSSPLDLNEMQFSNNFMGTLMGMESTVAQASQQAQYMSMPFVIPDQLVDRQCVGCEVLFCSPPELYCHINNPSEQCRYNSKHPNNFYHSGGIVPDI